MIESVSTSSVQSPVLRSSPQSANPFSAASIANPSNFVSSRVRVDNLQNVAILEYRSADGNVVQQYPTEAQIQAFKTAERLATEHTQNVSLEHIAAPSSSPGGKTTSVASSGASASVSASAAASRVPTTSDIVAAAASYSPPAAPGANSTQSVTA